MNRTPIPALMFLAAAVCASAQQPPPVPLFSAETIQSFTPPDNPITDAKAKLGDMIFDEKRVSSDNSVACNTCHSPRNGFTTHTPTSRGVGDQLGKRNAPSILNAMFYKSMFWDGRAATLEEQATLPILNPVEMGQKDPNERGGEAGRHSRNCRGVPEGVRPSSELGGHGQGSRRVRAHPAFHRSVFRPFPAWRREGLERLAAPGLGTVHGQGALRNLPHV